MNVLMEVGFEFFQHLIHYLVGLAGPVRGLEVLAEGTHLSQDLSCRFMLVQHDMDGVLQVTERGWFRCPVFLGVGPQQLDIRKEDAFFFAQVVVQFIGKYCQPLMDADGFGGGMSVYPGHFLGKFQDDGHFVAHITVMDFDDVISEKGW